MQKSIDIWVHQISWSRGFTQGFSLEFDCKGTTGTEPTTSTSSSSTTNSCTPLQNDLATLEPWRYGPEHVPRVQALAHFQSDRCRCDNGDQVELLFLLARSEMVIYTLGSFGIPYGGHINHDCAPFLSSRQHWLRGTTAWTPGSRPYAL